MPVLAGLGVALLVAGVLLAFIVVVTYNTVVALHRRVERALANVEVALKQRHDELPNLVAAVRGQLGFEQRVLDEVTRLRAAFSETAPLPEQAAVALATTAAVRSLFAVVEQYPDLKSSANVLALQEEIERLETLIARRRELHNEQVYQHNATIRQLPAVLLAGIFGWQPMPFFDAEAHERQRPVAALDTR
jgi:LemA protein